MPLADAKKTMEATGGTWTVVTSDQWQFLRGISVLNPNTPSGLPIGDGAALVTGKPGASGLVFFTDGDKACSPMKVPPIFLPILMDVGSGVIKHEGGGL